MSKNKNTIKITNREFKGVWIDKSIYCDPNLTPTEKFLLVEITSFANNDNVCFASNQHFSNFLGVDKATVSRMISKLKKMGYISISFTYKPNSKEIAHRLITPNFGFSMNLTPLTQKSIPLDSEVKDTNTVVTNTNFTNTNTISSKKNSKNSSDRKSVDSSLNEKHARKERDRELKKFFMKNIWDRYPIQHRVGERLCFSRFKSAIKNGSSQEEIIKGFNTYLKVIEMNKRNGTEQYIKRLDNWFAAESWKNPNKYMKSQMDKKIEQTLPKANKYKDIPRVFMEGYDTEPLIDLEKLARDSGDLLSDQN